MTSYLRSENGSHNSSLSDTNQTVEGAISPPKSAEISPALQFEFFDKEEEKRRKEYRERVEKHYCRLIEEENLSPESASLLSDAFAEAEVKAKYGSVKERSEASPEYHTGIDKTVWSAIDHQRSKSLERLRSHGKSGDSLSNDNIVLSLMSDSGNNSVNMDLSQDGTFIDSDAGSNTQGVEVKNQCDLNESCESYKQGGLEADDLNESHESFEQEGFDLNESCESFEQQGFETDEHELINNHDYENIAFTNGNQASGENSDNTDTLVGSESEVEFDGKEREFINKRGDQAVEKSMDIWMGGVKEDELEIDPDGRLVYKDRVRQYKHNIAAKDRERLRDMLKLSSAVPSASPTPMDYDADEENSYRGNISHDNWSDDDLTSEDDNVHTADLKPVNFTQQPMSSRSSVSSDKSRVDPRTYQSYTAGLLHSSGKSEKFLKLQKHYEVLERITEIEEKTRISGKAKDWIDNPTLKNELFAKYDVQSLEELQWLYQELSEAQKNAEFFYDLQRLAVYQWKPADDFGLKKKGKSLGDLKEFYEKIEKEEKDALANSYFRKAMDKSKAENQTENKPKYTPRALYGTNIPERLDSYEIYVAERKNQNKTDTEKDNLDKLHVRSMSASFSKHLQDIDAQQKRSDSSKGSMFGKVPSPESQAISKKPQVGEVIPVQRYVRPKSPKSPLLSNISPGPHDFASRTTETASIARPLQSNLEIYNSLENPQYQASFGLEGRPVHPPRKTSLTKTTDMFMQQGQTQDKSQSNIMAENDIEQPVIENADSVVHANFVRPLPDSDRDSINWSAVKDRRNDNSSVKNVKSFVANLEELNNNGNENLNNTNKWAVTRSRTCPDLLHNQPAYCNEVEEYETARATPIQKGFSENDIRTVEVPNSHTEERIENKATPFRTGAKMTTGFKVKNLRSLATNNEFSKSKFFPGKPERKPDVLDNTSYTDNRKTPETEIRNKIISGIRKDSEPKLHSPVVSQIYTGKHANVKIDTQLDVRRGSTSSTDTFIVKESDDELDTISHKDNIPVQEPIMQPVNVNNSRTYIQPNHERDLSKEIQNTSLRPRSAKPFADYVKDSELTNGRHCIPRFGSGDVLGMRPETPVTGKYTSKLVEIKPFSKHSYVSNTNTVDLINMTGDSFVKNRETNYDAYVPPVEILKDVARNQDIYKRTEPVEKPKKLSLVGRMTMDYLHELGSEWERSKLKNLSKRKEVDNQQIVQPHDKPFIGSDLAASPNKWVPVKIENTSRVDIPVDKNRSAEEQQEQQPVPLRENNVAVKDYQGGNSLYRKYLTLPRKKTSQRPEGYKASDAYSYNTLPKVKQRSEKGVPKSLSIPGKNLTGCCQVESFLL